MIQLYPDDINLLLKKCTQIPDSQIQFMLSPAGDEVTTIARDGCVRAWYWDTVEQADPPEEDPYVELNPVAETCVSIQGKC